MNSFAGIVVVTQLIYTTVSREMARFIIALGTNGSRAHKSRYLTPRHGMSYSCHFTLTQ